MAPDELDASPAKQPLWTDVFDEMETDTAETTVADDDDRTVTEVLDRNARTRTIRVALKKGGETWRREQRVERARAALQAAKDDVDLANTIIDRFAGMDESTTVQQLAQQVLRFSRVVKRSTVANRRALVLILDVEDDTDSE